MNLISENYLMHHGVKGMKWGVRKKQETYQRAAERAKKFSQYAQESHNKYKAMSSAKGPVRKINNEDGHSYEVDKETVNRWKRVSSRQVKAYNDLYKKYSSTPVNKITRKDYKNAKKFLNRAFEDAELSDYPLWKDSSGRNTKNYQLDRDYSFETGKFNRKK